LTDGILYSIDLYPDRDPVKSTIERLRGERRIVFIKGDSVEVGKGWDKGDIDVLLCDSNHSYRHVLNELITWGKVIFVHDTLRPEGGTGPPYDASKEYAERNGRKFLNLDFKHGLGLIV